MVYAFVCSDNRTDFFLLHHHSTIIRVGSIDYQHHVCLPDSTQTVISLPRIKYDSRQMKIRPHARGKEMKREREREMTALFSGVCVHIFSRLVFHGFG